MESLAKVIMTEDKYAAITELVSRGDRIRKRFQEFKKNEAIIEKKFWGLISYTDYNREALFKEFDTDLTFTFPSFGGAGRDKWRVCDKTHLIRCKSLAKFSPHEECYLTSEDCAALSYAVKCYGEKKDD